MGGSGENHRNHPFWPKWVVPAKSQNGWFRRKPPEPPRLIWGTKPLHCDSGNF